MSYYKGNTEIYGPKYKVHVLALLRANRIMMLSSWFCENLIFLNYNYHDKC